MYLLLIIRNCWNKRSNSIITDKMLYIYTIWASVPVNFKFAVRVVTEKLFTAEYPVDQTTEHWLRKYLV